MDSTATRTVLIAEDNPALLKVTQFSLERAGLAVESASDGMAALEMLREKRYGLLVTDQQMPRLCGVDLVREARELPTHKETPVILLTAKAMELSHDELAEELAIHHVLRKPFSPLEVSRLVDQLLASTVGD
ncbi:MAG: response regulator [Planctomycetota bacterium]